MGGCIEYEKLLDGQRSTGNGAFDLTIPADATSYVVSYCEPGYSPRVEDYNSNTPDGAPVEGEPVARKKEKTPPNALAGALAAEIRRLAGTAAYLNQTPDEYNTVLVEVQRQLPKLDVKSISGQLLQLRQQPR